MQVFRGANVKLGNWRQVTVQKLVHQGVETPCERDIKYDTHGKVVRSPLVVLEFKIVRKGGGFFYGTSNENYTESLRSQISRSVS